MLSSYHPTAASRGNNINVMWLLVLMTPVRVKVVLLKYVEKKERNVVTTFKILHQHKECEKKPLNHERLGIHYKHTYILQYGLCIASVSMYGYTNIHVGTV